MSDLHKTQQLYKKKYKELIDGASAFRDGNELLYVKHLTEADIGELELSTEKYHKEAEEKGLPVEQDKISILVKQDLWTQEKEEEIKELKIKIATLQDTHKKLFLKAQISKSQESIDAVIQSLGKLVTEREELLGLTCEKYADRKSNEEIVLYCFYKDRELKQKFFTPEEFDELHRDKLYRYIQVYNDISREFSSEEMKRMAALPFFINLFFLCEDNIYTLYGKPVISLTLAQVDAYNSAKTYKSIMSQGNSPPDEMYESLDELVSFYDSYSGAGGEALKEATNKGSQSIVGATVEEMKKFTKGEDGAHVITLDSLEAKLAKEGRNLEDLSMVEIAKLHQ